MASYISNAIGIAILAIGFLSLTISPNFWAFVNTLQILRTIILLEINMPVKVRSMIGASSELAGLDLSFGLFNLPTDDESNIKWAIPDNQLLQGYFENYGVPEYKHWNWVKQTILSNILPFVLIFVSIIV